MENLRWILLAIGVVIILGIYLFARLKTMNLSLPRRSRPRRAAPHHAAAPVLDDFEAGAGTVPGADASSEVTAGEVPADEPVITVPARPARSRREAQPLQDVPAQPEQPAQPARERRPEVSPDQVFSLFVLAPHGVPFRGPLLLGALAKAGLEHGEMQIYHRVAVVDGREQTLFSVANIREPGTFDPDAMENFTTQGLALFMQVHPGTDAVPAFEAMVDAARSLADSLDGTVCDATRSVLTRQTIGHMREEVIARQLQQRMAKTAS
jgi:cell division protein ZipA